MPNRQGITTQYCRIDPYLSLITLDQPLEGFRNFISSWLYHSQDFTFLIDPGPLNSLGLLKNALADLGVKHLDYIFLTHIHLDHAGGTGKLLECFPTAKVLCHPKGIEHLISPAKLWEGSLKILGDIARVYGEIVAIPQEKIFFSPVIKKGPHTIEALETPGHAPHHVSFVFNNYLFAGEVAGMYTSLPEAIYLRPATPPQFEQEISLASLDKVLAKKQKIICFGHYGFHNDAAQILSLAREQLTRWTKVVEEQMASDNNWEEKAIAKLMECDEMFSNFKQLKKDIQKRERYFIANTLKGIAGYLNTRR